MTTSRPRRVRLAEVARAAGVSVSTASRALNGYPDITEATRKTVEAVAARLGYRAHATARSLRVGDAGVVAAVIDPETLHPRPGTVNYFWSLFLSEIMANFAEAGYSLLTVMHAQAPQVLGRLPYDAAMVLTTRRDITDVVAAVPFGVPLVTAAGRAEHDRKDITMGHDYAQAMVDVLDHLTEAGCHRPAVVAPPIAHTFVDAMTTAAAAHPSQPLVTADLDEAIAQGCDGVFMMAADTVDTVARLRTADSRMRLVMLSDSRVDPYLDPPVSTLAFLPVESGQAAVQALSAAINGDSGFVELPYRLTPRASSTS